MFSQQVIRDQKAGDRGAVLAEYAALFAFVVIVAVAALSAFGISILELYNDNTDRYGAAIQRNVG